MRSPVLLGIYRERVYSPGKVQADAAVLDAALSELAGQGFRTESRGAESFDGSSPRPDIILTMAQSDRVLNILDQWSVSGIRIINSVQSIRNCYRKPLMRILANAGVPVPKCHLVELGEEGTAEICGVSNRLWLKRGDVHAVQEGDVASVASEKDLTLALRHFRKIGVQDLIVQNHTEGPVVKFYGVGQQRFFKAYLESSGEEVTARMDSLGALATQAADILGLQVYGGDAVLSESGPVLIDFNDWPSFSRCSLSAGHAIAEHVRECLQRPISIETQAKAI